MSKVDALRALREAKYAAARANAPGSGVKRVAPAVPPAGTAAPATKVPKTARPALEVVPDVEAVPDVQAAPCGHRNMGGKSCSRPAGHTEKNHRYC